MTLSPRIVAPAIVLLTVALTLGAVPLLRETLHYPTLTMEVGKEIRLSFVQFGATSAALCEERLARLADTMRKNCPACSVSRKRCAGRWDDELERVFSAAPLETPSARLPDGVVTYVSSVPGLALATCEASERQTASAAPSNRARCFPAGAARPR